MIYRGRIVNITEVNAIQNKSKCYSMISNSYFESMIANQFEDYYNKILDLLSSDNYKDFAIDHIESLKALANANSNNLDKLIYNILSCNIASSPALYDYIYYEFFEVNNEDLHRIKDLYYHKLNKVNELYNKIAYRNLSPIGLDPYIMIKIINNFFNVKYSNTSNKNYIRIEEIDCDILIGEDQYELPFNILDLWQMIITYDINAVVISHALKDDTIWKAHTIQNYGFNVDDIVSNLSKRYKNIMLLCCNPNGYTLKSEDIFRTNDRKLFYPRFDLLMECKTKNSRIP